MERSGAQGKERKNREERKSEEEKKEPLFPCLARKQKTGPEIIQ